MRPGADASDEELECVGVACMIAARYALGVLEAMAFDSQGRIQLHLKEQAGKEMRVLQVRKVHHAKDVREKAMEEPTPMRWVLLELVETVTSRCSVDFRKHWATPLLEQGPSKGKEPTSSPLMMSSLQLCVCQPQSKHLLPLQSENSRAQLEEDRKLEAGKLGGESRSCEEAGTSCRRIWFEKWTPSRAKLHTFSTLTSKPQRQQQKQHQAQEPLEAQPGVHHLKVDLFSIGRKKFFQTPSGAVGIEFEQAIEGGALVFELREVKEPAEKLNSEQVYELCLVGAMLQSDRMVRLCEDGLHRSLLNRVRIDPLQSLNLSAKSISAKDLRELHQSVSKQAQKEGRLTKFEEYDAITQAPSPSTFLNLIELNLSHNALHDAMNILARGAIDGLWPNITLLNLNSCKLDNASIHDFCQASYPNLRILILWFNIIDARGVQYLTRNGFPNLTTLSLNGNCVGDEGATYLMEATWPKISKLSLYQCYLGDLGVQSLLSCGGIAARLESLNLEFNSISGKGVKWITQANERVCCQDKQQHFSCRAILLNMSNNPQIGDAGIQELIKVTWPRLRSLSLYNCGLSLRAAQALYTQQRWPSLRTLCLQGNRIPSNFHALISQPESKNQKPPSRTSTSRQTPMKHGRRQEPEFSECESFSITDEPVCALSDVLAWSQGGESQVRKEYDRSLRERSPCKS